MRQSLSERLASLLGFQETCYNFHVFSTFINSLSLPIGNHDALWMAGFAARKISSPERKAVKLCFALYSQDLIEIILREDFLDDCVVFS